MLHRAIIYTHGDPADSSQCGRPLKMTRAENAMVLYEYICPIHGNLSRPIPQGAVWQQFVDDPRDL